MEFLRGKTRKQNVLWLSIKPGFIDHQILISSKAPPTHTCPFPSLPLVLLCASGFFLVQIPTWQHLLGEAGKGTQQVNSSRPLLVSACSRFKWCQ